MIDVLLVDDEPLIRAGLRYGIQWTKYGMNLISEAENVNDAIESIKQSNDVDLVLSDIVMPEKSGFELIRWIKTYNPMLPVVVLTHHDDFSYIQKALRLGAIDYVLKTELDSKNMDKTLHRISKLAFNYKMNKQKFAFSFIENVYKQAIVLIGLEKDLKEDLIEQKITSMIKITDVYWLENKKVLLLFDQILDEDGLIKLKKEFDGKGIILFFRNIVGSKVTQIIISSEHFMTYDYFYKYIPGLNIYDVEVMKHKHVESTVEISKYKQIEEKLSSLKWLYDDNLFEEVLCSIEKNRLLPQMIYNLFYNVNSSWHQLFSEENLFNFYETSHFKYWYQWVDWLTNIRSRILSSSRLSSISNDVISRIYKVLSWINENYYKADISLSQAASMANLSISYFSKCFKNITGKTFNRYVRDLRITHSKKLLTRTTLPIGYIAEFIGFSDQFYFTRTFKKCVGLTPGDYKSKYGIS